MQPGPSIGIVVVHHGADDVTRRCLDALLDDDESPSSRVVLVENGPGTAFAERLAAELPGVEVVGDGTNLGFAAGCNLGVAALGEVQLVGLVNSDVLVTPGWLTPLVATIDTDPLVAAASPKMCFEGRFHEVRVTAGASAAPGRGDRRPLAWRLRRVLVAGDDLTSRCHLVSGFWEPDGVGTWAGPDVLLRVPATGAPTASLELDVELPGQELRVEPGSQVLVPGQGVSRHLVDLCGEPVRVVNNVGTEWRADGYGIDLGFEEVDRGQHDHPRSIPAWCGGAVLLRGEYLRDTGGFDERLFLYYEDLELAIRGARRGWRYRFEPKSVVDHRHAASFAADPGGITARRERNRLLVLIRHGHPTRVAAAVARFVLVTASYLRREVVAPVLRGDRPRWTIPAARWAALRGTVALAPAMLRSRRADRRRREQAHWSDC